MNVSDSLENEEKIEIKTNAIASKINCANSELNKCAISEKIVLGIIPSNLRDLGTELCSGVGKINCVKYPFEIGFSHPKCRVWKNACTPAEVKTALYRKKCSVFSSGLGTF